MSTESTPAPNYFNFVISELKAREMVETGMFVQVITKENHLVLGVIEQMVRTNKYFDSPDIIHGSASGLAPSQIYPSDRWDYIVAETKVLGMFKDGLQQRATQPVIPGATVEIVDPMILRKFLGLSNRGLLLGRLRQMDMPVTVDLDSLLQKHLAILSISGGGKSYATSVIIEELLKRSPSEGRPALLLFDVHGEFTGLKGIKEHPEFKNSDVEIIDGEDIKIAVRNLKTADFSKIQPNMSSAQLRELGRVIARLRRKDEPLTIEKLISEVEATEMNQLVKEALLGWLNSMKASRIFSYYEDPQLEEVLRPGKLVIVNLAPVISLWKKQIILYCMMERIFSLRRQREIPPVVTFIEEAHQFCPEMTTAPSKGIIETIAREGRKFLCSLVLISQRPVNLSTTALSQCNSQLILKIVNPNDQTYIGRTSEGITAETLKVISSLGVGEGLLTGQAVNYPIFIQVRKRITESQYNEVSMASESIQYEQLTVK